MLPVITWASGWDDPTTPLAPCRGTPPLGGYEVGRALMINDELMAMSASRNGTTVLTVNNDDRRIAKSCPFEWERV